MTGSGEQQPGEQPHAGEEPPEPWRPSDEQPSYADAPVPNLEAPSPHPDSPAPTPDAPRPTPGAPLYRGEPLDAERGPGLGCFWIQVVLLGIFLVLTPLTVVWRFEPWISATLLILTLVLLLFAGQTVIFLLRLVAADRRTRRRPQSPTARKTVGMLEDEDAAGTSTRDGEPPD